MTYTISQKTIVYEDTTSYALRPKYVFPSKEEVKQYLEEHPFPESEDNHYSQEDLLFDTQCDGVWILPDNLTKEQKEYIEDLVYHFL